MRHLGFPIPILFSLTATRVYFELPKQQLKAPKVLIYGVGLY